MKEEERRAAKVGELLDQLIGNPEIPLRFCDTYTLLIAVLLSAQCTDLRVNQVTQILFAHAQTPQEMIALSPDEIEEIIRPCGLGPTKADAIWKLSHQLLEKHGGEVPASFEALEALPGVGHKTASVVMVQGFGIPAFPIDTHIYRLARRWGLSQGTSIRQVEEDLKSLYPSERWGRLHLQIILYARKCCPARGHKVEECPICSALGVSEL